jgi:hypothetical protein
LAHWFGLRPSDVDDLTYGELTEFLSRLSKTPPVGATFMVSPKE